MLDLFIWLRQGGEMAGKGGVVKEGNAKARRPVPSAGEDWWRLI